MDSNLRTDANGAGRRYLSLFDFFLLSLSLFLLLIIFFQPVHVLITAIVVQSRNYVFHQGACVLDCLIPKSELELWQHMRRAAMISQTQISYHGAFCAFQLDYLLLFLSYRKKETEKEREKEKEQNNSLDICKFFSFNQIDTNQWKCQLD